MTYQDPDLFAIDNNILDSVGGNFNTGPLPLPMGQTIQVLDEQITGSIYIFAIDLAGSLDCANAIIDITEVIGERSNKVLSLSCSELDYIGDYGTTNYAPKLLRYSDIDKTYSILYSVGGAPMSNVDEYIVNITTPAPTLDPLIPVAVYSVTVGYTKYKPIIRALEEQEQSSHTNPYQPKEYIRKPKTGIPGALAEIERELGI